MSIKVNQVIIFLLFISIVLSSCGTTSKAKGKCMCPARRGIVG